MFAAITAVAEDCSCPSSEMGPQTAPCRTKVRNKDHMKVEEAIWKKKGFSGMKGPEKVTD